MRGLPFYALAGLALGPGAQAQMATITHLQPLLFQAIRDGYAEAVYETPASRAFFQREFATAAPLEYRVKRLEPIAGQPGCARLALTATQRDVADRNATQRAAAPQNLSITWQVAYCEAGHFAGQAE